MQRCFFSTIFTILAVVIAASAVFLPALTVPFALISTTVFSFVSALSYTKASRLCSQAVVAVFYIITLIVTKDPTPGLLILALFFPVGLAVGSGCMMRKKLNSTGAGALIYGSVFFLIVFAVYAVFSTYPDVSFSAAAENIKGMIVPEIEKAIFSIMESDQNISSEYNYIYSYEYLASLAFSYIPTVIGIWIIGSATVSFWLLKAIFKVFDQDVAFMGRFSEFKVSRTGAFVYFLATIASVMAMGSALSTTALNFSGVMSVVLSYAGISLISFLLELKNVSDPVRYIIVGFLLLVGLMPFGFSYLLSLVGLFDAYLDIRERFNNSGV